MEVPLREVRVAHHLAEEGDRRGHPLHDERFERELHLGDRLVAIAPVHDELGDHRVVERWHGVPSIGMRIHAHAVAARHVEYVDLSRRRLEVPHRVLGVHAALDHVPAQRRGLLLPHRHPRRDADLFLHEIHSGQHLGHGMLHLDARVHLHEEELAVRIKEHLDRAGPHVVDCLGSAHGRLAHRCTQRGSEGGTRRLLDQLLVTALDGAVALAEVDHIAVGVAEDLELDVPRAFEVFLDVHIAVAEGRERFGAGELKGPGEIVSVARDAHPLPAPARGGLDDDREAGLHRERQRLVHVVDRPRGPRNDRHAAVGHRLSCRGLVAHHADLVRRWPDEGDPGGGTDLGELRILGEESIPRMNRIRPRDLGSRDQARDLEIALARRRGTETDIIVGESDMQRLAIGLGVDRHGLDAEFPRGTNDPERDFAAIRNENLLEHQ